MGWESKLKTDCGTINFVFYNDRLLLDIYLREMEIYAQKPTHQYL